jgi:hypothetical protein
MKRWVASVRATDAERAEPRPGDEVLAAPNVVMDRGFTVTAPVADVWPWLEQLGKRRGGWYLPRRIERFLPRDRRALRRIDHAFLGLEPGDVIPDYGGRDETFEVVAIDRRDFIVYNSQRGRVSITWSIVLRPDADTGGTRVLLRLRMAGVKRVWLATSVGGLFDLVTIAGMAAGLRERVASEGSGRTR